MSDNEENNGHSAQIDERNSDSENNESGHSAQDDSAQTEIKRSINHKGLRQSIIGQNQAIRHQI